MWWRFENCSKGTCTTNAVTQEKSWKIKNQAGRKVSKRIPSEIKPVGKRKRRSKEKVIESKIGIKACVWTGDDLAQIHFRKWKTEDYIRDA